MKKRIVVPAVVVGLLVVAGSYSVATDDTAETEPSARPSVVETTEAPPATESAPAPETETETETESAEPEVSVSQQNALRSAQSYVDTLPFSREGLINQLEFEKYPTEDATWAVDQLDVDWNAEAAEAAESYIDTMPFSRDELINQLLFEGFTEEQATYAVDQVGL